MKPTRFFYLAFLILLFAFSTSVYADVPQMINYQGKLTSTGGALINDTLDMVFTIYLLPGGLVPVWAETLAVVVENGSYATLLGSVHPIPYELFAGPVMYLGIKVGDDTEMTPRKEIVSTPYAYRAATVQSGGFPCSDCDDRFVNTAGPDSLVASSDSGFLVRTTGSGIEDASLVGIKVYAENSQNGGAVGGEFVSRTLAVAGGGWDIGAYGKASCYDFPCWRAAGIKGEARNTSGGYDWGIGYGGWFSAYTQSGDAWGVYADARADAEGTVIGGEFSASSEGTGTHYGVWSNSVGSSSSPTYGIYSEADNTSSGDVYGGWFHADSAGTGNHYGLYTESYGNTSSLVYGIRSYARNSADGNVYAGYFYASAIGPGYKVGVYASAPAGEGYAGYFNGNVYIDDSLVVYGEKSAAVKVDNGEYRLLYSQESPEVWFEDFGEGELVGGRAHIELDPLFLQTVTINTQNPMKVFVQLTSGDPMNVVVNKGTTGFDVVAQDFKSSAKFDYRIVAKRKGFENVRLARMGGPTPEEMDAEHARMEEELEKERAQMAERKAKMQGQRTRMDQERMEMERW